MTFYPRVPAPAAGDAATAPAADPEPPLARVSDHRVVVPPPDQRPQSRSATIRSSANALEGRAERPLPRIPAAGRARRVDAPVSGEPAAASVPAARNGDRGDRPLRRSRVALPPLPRPPVKPPAPAGPGSRCISCGSTLRDDRTCPLGHAG